MTTETRATNVDLDPTLHLDAKKTDDGKITIQQPLGDMVRNQGTIAAPPIWCPVISVDDHLVEPPTLFDSVPAKYRDAAPKLIEANGHWGWEFANVRCLIMAVDTASGNMGRSDENEAAGYLDTYRPGVIDVDARVQDMDLAGVWASLNFPSSTWGFAGTTFMQLADHDAALACVRAFNDWHVEGWCGAHPDRFIPCQLGYLPDPEATASEIRRNAKRGVRAISFSENPYHLGLPSLYSDFWDPVWQACVDTETVINIHVGSSGHTPMPSADTAIAARAVLFGINSMEAIIEWIFAKIPLRYPSIKVVLSEGGVSWVPTILERLSHAFRRREEMSSWDFNDPHPTEIFQRNFMFTSIDDPSAFRLLDIIGDDKVMFEVDYPHPDSTWPETQSFVRQELEKLSDESVRKICFENAAKLYDHPAPPPKWLTGSTRFATPS